MRTTVAVVGGGRAGLYAARLLHTSGIDFRLLEARHRLGGRIFSVDAAGGPSKDGFDLGPSWFWSGMHPAMAEVVRELGLGHFAQHSDGDVVIERSRYQPPQRFHPMRQEPQSMRFEGGTGAVVTALANGLPPERLRTGTRVTHIMLNDKGVALTLTADNGSAESLSAEQVILALPPRLLAGTVTFEPALEPKTAARRRNTATWMAPHAKVFALYDRPFWRDDTLSGAAQSVVGRSSKSTMRPPPRVRRRCSASSASMRTSGQRSARRRWCVPPSRSSPACSGRMLHSRARPCSRTGPLIR